MANVKTLLAGSLAGLMITSLGFCADKPDTSKLPPAATTAGLTYDKDIKKMFEDSCVKCHSGNRPKSKYTMETLEGIIKGGSSDEAAIIKGRSADSPLVWYIADLVEEMEMPPLDKRDKYPVLTKEQIGLVRAWIDQGAK